MRAQDEKRHNRIRLNLFFGIGCCHHRTACMDSDMSVLCLSIHSFIFIHFTFHFCINCWTAVVVADATSAVVVAAASTVKSVTMASSGKCVRFINIPLAIFGVNDSLQTNIQRMVKPKRMGTLQNAKEKSKNAQTRRLWQTGSARRSVHCTFLYSELIANGAHEVCRIWLILNCGRHT